MVNKVYSIEGNIGSGKTTLLKILQAHPDFKDVVFVREPVDRWQTVIDNTGSNILEKFYSDKKQYAYPFQELTLMTRFAAIKKAIKNNPGKTIIIERSIWTDKQVFAQMLFDSGDIEDMMFQVYKENFKVIEEDFIVDGFIYMDTNPDKCMERVSKRNRTGETIPLVYLKRCKSYHDDWLNNSLEPNLNNVLKISTSVEFETTPKTLDEIVQNIKQFMKIKL